jgi:hypothetical protein
VLGAKYLVKGQFVLVDLGWDGGLGVESPVRKSGVQDKGIVMVTGNCGRKRM